MTDYTNARYWALSSIGYGKGHTPEEAVENYVTSQLRNFRAKDTIFKTRPKWEAALRNGEASPSLWLAPEGFTGFVNGMGSWWTREEGDNQEFSIHDRVFTFGGAYLCRVQVVINSFEAVVELRADGDNEAEALANAEQAVLRDLPHATITGLTASVA
jgi:hypothetical protein